MAEDPFAALARADYTKVDERAEAQLRTKWEMCPLTLPENMKTLVLFTMSNVKQDSQKGIENMKAIAAEMSVASQSVECRVIATARVTTATASKQSEHSLAVACSIVTCHIACVFYP